MMIFTTINAKEVGDLACLIVSLREEKFQSLSVLLRATQLNDASPKLKLPIPSHILHVRWPAAQ